MIVEEDQRVPINQNHSSYHKRRRRGQEAHAPPLRSYLVKSGTYVGKLENIRAYLKMKTFFIKHINFFLFLFLFFWRTHYTFESIFGQILRSPLNCFALQRLGKLL